MARLELIDLKVSYDGKTNILEDYNLEIEEESWFPFWAPRAAGRPRP